MQKGPPDTVDYDEPRRVADAIAQMGLRHAVVTSVNRDDRSDGGAELFAMTIRAIRARLPNCTVKVLVPDFQGSRSAMGHCLGCPTEYPRAQHRDGAEPVPARYGWAQTICGSLMMLRHASLARPAIQTKYGHHAGTRRDDAEIYETLGDLREHGVEILTVGQYLRPSSDHLGIQKYYTPEAFERIRDHGRQIGFRHVESGALVRSSKAHADEGVHALIAGGSCRIDRGA